MTLSIKIPSKTFLAGEYNVLFGGQAIILCTKPYFHISLEPKTNAKQSSSFHPKSPAAKYLLDNKEIFDGHIVTVHDPHNKKGGFGASGAHFLGVFLLNQLLKDSEFDINKVDQKKLLDTFWNYYPDGQTKPSGADIIAQLNGFISCFSTKDCNVEKLAWNFKDIGFYVFPTYNKVDTHSHVSNISIDYDNSINQTVINISKAIKDSNSSNLIKYLNEFKEYQINKGLVAKESFDMLKTLDAAPGVLFSKGCGALGADVILVIVDKNFDKEFKSLAQINNFNLIASEKDITYGALIETTQSIRNVI